MNRKRLLLLCVLLMAAVLFGCGKRTEDSMESLHNGETIAAEKSVDSTESTNQDSNEPASAASSDQSGNQNATASESNSTENGNPNAALPENETTEPTTGLISKEDVSVGVVPGYGDSSIDTPVIPAAPEDNVETPPAEGTAQETLPADFRLEDLTYEGYMAMSAAQQEAVIGQFGSPDDFMVWFNAVKAIYEAQHPGIEVGVDGVVDASQIGG